MRRPADCDDTKPTIRPGVIDVPDNGIDEDCSGVDSINLDRDGDGIPRPQDCDDTNGAIKPGLREVIGNAIDENCDTLIAPFPPLSGSVSSTWTRVGRRTRNLTLVAKGFPRGTRITVRCVGSRRCPRGTKRRRVRNARRAVNLHATLGSRALESGARVEVAHHPRGPGRPAADLPLQHPGHARRVLPLRSAGQARRVVLTPTIG